MWFIIAGVSGILFLDRDGVINREIGDYISHPDAFELLPAIVPLIASARQRAYRVVVVTNQGGIGKGLYTHSDLAKIHAKMEKLLAAQGVAVDDLYYCPHHPDHDGLCLCRKPGSLMLEKALAKFRADANHSLLIGDHPRDIEAAKAVGVKAILIESNKLQGTELDWK